MNERKEKIKVFFDYTCPWVRQANYWLIDLEREALKEIIRSYTKEAGVRNLEREISKIA